MQTAKSRFTVLTVCSLLLTLYAPAFGQTRSGDAEAAAAVRKAVANMGRRAPVPVNQVVVGTPTNLVFNAATGAVIGGSGRASINKTLDFASSGDTDTDNDFNITHRRPNVSNIDGLNTVATFDGAFVAQAGPSAGNDFRFTMLGNDPRLGGTTVYPTRIDEVSLQLLNADGSVFTTVAFDPFEKRTLESPNFEPLDFRSGHNVEFGDAVHRAQFFNVMKNDWHTLLIPKIVNKATITVPFFVNVQLPDGRVVQARAYFTGTAADGSTFVLMLSPLFDFFFDNEVVNQINDGNFRTHAMNLTMFPNTFLFDLNVNDPNTPGSCCVLGFHTYFLDGVFPESRWVTQYASWISPGLFGAGFQDVTALSHELAESFGNPFVSNPTPNWQFPGQPANSKLCQANLEEGDPIEVLPNATAAIEVKERGFEFVYHPQNIPLLQWFEMGRTSSAIDGAFSFPDETVLPNSAIPCPH